MFNRPNRNDINDDAQDIRNDVSQLADTLEEVLKSWGSDAKDEAEAAKRAAEQAKKDLAEQEGIILPSERMQGGAISGGKVQERIQTYKDKVALHQRNVEAIQKELANLR
mgnify:CR=1 FL=1